MPADPSGSRRSLAAWLAYNPSGIPRVQALRTAALGAALGGLGGLLAAWLAGVERSPWSLGLGIVGGIVGGALGGALGVLLIARLLDRRFRAEDRLIGYSGLVRMLLHAGELSFLGALGGGIGGGAGGFGAGLLTGALGGGLVGGALYRARGLGMGLGLIVGALAGALGGAIGGALGWL